MSNITATLVMQLREKSGAGVIDCKRALVESQGNLDAALERLRASDAAKAAKKVARVAAEGLVSLVVEGASGAMVEVNTETDFAARSESIRHVASALARIALGVKGDDDALLNAPAPDGDGRVRDLIARLAARTGENVCLRRSACVTASHGVVASYVHNVMAPGLGSIGVLVALRSDGRPEALLDIGRKVAMHVAASAPRWVSPEDIPQQVIAQKRAELAAEAGRTSKPAQIVDKMIEGRMRKFYDEATLERQPFVVNPDERVGEALHEAESAAGAPIKIEAFARFRVGEGIDRA